VIERFKSFIEEHNLFSGADRILLAISGGIDSMVMLELFLRTGYNIGVAHCNFTLRGEDSDTDEALVDKIAAKHDLPFYSRRFDTSSHAIENKVSVQMAARELRYAFFDELCTQHGYDHVATAHHLDDQIETFFINLARGTGIAGLHGIPLRNEKIVRPMMFAYRRDLEEYQKENKVEFREDDSNRELKYMRNKIRHEIIPLFTELNPSFRGEMTNTMKRLSGTEQIYKQVIELAIRETVSQDGGRYYIDVNKLKMFSPLEQVLFEIVVMFGFRQDDIHNIINAMDGISGKKFLSQAWQLVIDRDKIIISAIQQKEVFFDILIDEDIEKISKPIPLTFERLDAKDFSIPLGSNIAALDVGRLQFPLIIRKWEQGDTFIPLGMKNRKKLSDFFIDEKISVVDKENIWVLCSSDEIAWIIGHRIADPFKITNQTKKIFLVRHPASETRNSSG